MSIRASHPDSQKGVAALGIIFFIVLFLFLLFGFDMGYIAFSEYCEDTPFTDCVTGKKLPEPVQPATEAPVITAKGSYTVDKYTVDITMQIPTGGGALTGTFSGTCDGKITGTAEKDGAISGKAFGSCSPLVVPVPAKAEFDGTVIPSTRSVPIMGTGSAMGISKSGTITLTY